LVQRRLVLLVQQVVLFQVLQVLRLARLVLLLEQLKALLVQR
jgi:hypothetical protein